MRILKLLVLGAICLLVGVGAGLLSCQLNQKQNEIYLPPNVYGSWLSKLWNITVENTEIDNSTAVLE